MSTQERLNECIPSGEHQTESFSHSLAGPGKQRHRAWPVPNDYLQTAIFRICGEKQPGGWVLSSWTRLWHRRNSSFRTSLAACSTPVLYTKATRAVCSNQDPSFVVGQGIIVSNGRQTRFSAVNPSWLSGQVSQVH